MIKQKIAFAMIMGTITTGLISYILISINFGWAHQLLKIWLKAWLISYLISIPVILLMSPMIDKVVKKIFPVKLQSVIDIFRIENKKIAEHWDVQEIVHEKSTNSHPMF